MLVCLSIPIVNAQDCIDPPVGGIAWWPMDEETGTNVDDIIGSNPGVHVNGPTIVEGINGNALQFDGSNDYVGVPDNDLWSFGANDFTVELWANFDHPGGGTLAHPGDIFIGNDEGAYNTRKWWFGFGGGYLHFHINGPGIGPQWFPRAPFAPVVGQWYHLAVTRRGDTYTVFIDGVAADSAVNTVTLLNPNAPLTIGQAEWLGFMSGRLDEITVYHRALSREELAAIYAAGGAGKCKLMIDTRQLSSVKLGEPFSQELRAIGGELPYTWSIEASSLPAGVSFTSDGILGGTPDETGEFPVTIRVTDGSGRYIEKAFTLNVILILPPPNIRVSKAGTAPVPGREIDYFILVENVGSSTSLDVEVLELVDPAMFTINSVFPDAVADLSYLQEASIVLWVIPELGAGESTVLSYQVTLDPSTPLGDLVVGGPVCSGSELAFKWYKCLIDGLQAFPACGVCASICQGCGIACGPIPVEIGECPVCLGICFTCLVGVPVPGGSSCLVSVYDFAKDCYEAVKESMDCASNEEPTQGAIDPNEKAVIAPKYIQPDQLLVYPIHYENIGTIEARDVFVTDVLDPDLDLSTLELLTPDGSSIDEATRTVKWDLLNIDLLPDSTGHVLFSIRPLPGLPSGTDIRNTADIQFEVFDIYTTNEVVNIIDAIPPAGTIDPLPDEVTTSEFSISWSGTDEIGEIDYFTILVSTDGSDFSEYITRTEDTTASFEGEDGHSYGFICIATDVAGNIEIQQPIAETETVVMTPNSAKAIILPSAWSFDWLIDTRGTVRSYVGNVAGDYNAEDIDPTTIMLNDEVPIYGGRYRIRPSMTGFEGSVLEISFSRQLAVQSLGEDAEAGTHTVTITGEFTDGNKFISEVEITLDGTPPAKIEAETDQPAIPTEFSLGNAYPNPFNPTTTIEFGVPRDGNVKIEVYNITGQKVKTLTNQYYTAGSYTVEWNSTDDSGNEVATGVYLYRMTASDFVETKKMVLMK